MPFSNFTSRSFINHFAKYFLLIQICLCLSVDSMAQISETYSLPAKTFDGFNIGLLIGSQNIYGGALIDDLDVLAQKSGFAIDFSVGFRKQIIKRKIVIGAEFLYGLTDGNLKKTDTRNQILIDYQNDTQLGIGLQIGVVFGAKKQLLIYLTAQQAKRVFDIEFTIPNGEILYQEDTQFFERYGVGFEFPIYKKLNLKGSIAKTSADFGDLNISMNVEDKLDFNLGVLLNF